MITIIIIMITFIIIMIVINIIIMHLLYRPHYLSANKRASLDSAVQLWVKGLLVVPTR